MTSKFFISRLEFALAHKTLYVMGCFGAPMTEANKQRYMNNHSYNKQAGRQRMISAASSDTFGFDCVNLIKGILWGWVGDQSKTYGGAKYASNGVPDVGADKMITLCKSVDTFSGRSVEPGEFVWMPGHCGVYVGDGYVIESSPKWKNGVQKTALSARKWEKHGYLPWIDYKKEAKPAMDNTPSNYAAEACEWAVKEGLFAGNASGDMMWHSPVTREQLAQILYNMR